MVRDSDRGQAGSVAERDGAVRAVARDAERRPADGGRGPLRVALVKTLRHASHDRYVDALAKGLAGERVDVTVETLGASPLVRIPWLEKPDDYVRRWVRFPLAIRHKRADVFHLVEHADRHLMKVLPGPRTVVTCHDLIPLLAVEGALPFEGPPPYTGREWWIRRYRWGVMGLKHAAAVVCPSRATRDDVVRLCGVRRDRVSVIPHGVGEHFKPLTPRSVGAARAKLGLSGRRLVLTVNSGAGFYKNFDTTLRVIAAIRKAGFDVTLVRVGSAMTAAERKTTRTLGLYGALVELGKVTETRLVELYNAADVLLFPSLYEGFGWPAIEAMACGTPVVTSDAPAIAEVVGNAAMTVPAMDVEGFADALTTLFSAPERCAELHAAGLLRAQRFSWLKACAAYEKLYLEVARLAA
jgi:glycosyltransferase involved in cell wall biosynthesis